MAGGARYDSDPPHSATTFGADGEVTGVELLIAIAVSGLQSGIGRLGGQHMPAASDVVAAPAIGEEAVVADAMEAVRQAVQKKAADELIGAKRHCPGHAVVSIVLPGEADLAVGERDQSAVGDGDAMGVAAEISQHLFGAAERWLGIDDPVDAPEFVEPGGEDRGLGKTGEIPEEAQLVGIEGIPQALQEQSTKQA